jgi:hypothetical protein
MTAGLVFNSLAIAAIVGAFCWTVFQGYHAPLPPKQRPIASPERGSLGEDIGDAIGGALTLAMALGALAALVLFVRWVWSW